MRQVYKHILPVILACWFISSCTVHEEAVEVQMPIALCLPVSEFVAANQPRYAAGNGQRRVLGDPGQTERFDLPRYAWFFAMKDDGADWEVLHREKLTLDGGSWEKTHYGGSYRTSGDSIYRYQTTLQILLDNNKVDGRVYAVMSNVDLTFNKTMTSINTLADLLDWQFDASSAEVQQNLQHIYTSPYNYIENGDYYGAFSNRHTKVPQVNLLLYHVAAKVDLKWNVDEDKRTGAEGVRLTYMEARNLYNGWSYAFRPMENTAPAVLSEGYNITNIVTSSDVGLWWEGRDYFYTLPYTVSGSPDLFPLQLTMKTNDDASDGYRLTLNQRIDTTDPFVPWIRGNFRLTKPLQNTTETKTEGVDYGVEP